MYIYIFVFINLTSIIIMQYILFAIFILFFAVLIGYIVECRRYSIMKKKSDAIDMEIEQVRRSTEKLILSAYDTIMKKSSSLKDQNLNN